MVTFIAQKLLFSSIMMYILGKLFCANFGRMSRRGLEFWPGPGTRSITDCHIHHRMSDSSQDVTFITGCHIHHEMSHLSQDVTYQHISTSINNLLRQYVLPRQAVRFHLNKALVAEIKGVAPPDLSNQELYLGDPDTAPLVLVDEVTCLFY